MLANKTSYENPSSISNLIDNHYFYYMEQLISYFETIPTAHRSLILVGGITFFWILEGIVPLFNGRYDKWETFPCQFSFFTFDYYRINFPLAFLLLKTFGLGNCQ